MARTYEVAFRISGALNGQFASAMAAAQNAMRGLGQSARQVNAAMAGSMGALSGYLSRLQSIAAQSTKFANLKATIPQTQTALQGQIAKTRELSAAYQQQKATIESFKASMQTLQAQQQALKGKWDAEKSTLAGLKAQLKSVGDAYRSISAAQGKGSAEAQRLKTQIDSLKASIEGQKSSVANAKSAYDTMRAAVKSAAQELKAAEASLRTLGTSFDSSKAKVKGLYDQLKSQKSQLESLKSSLSSAGFSTDHFIQSEMKLRSEIDATTRAIERQAQVAARLTSAQGNLNTASSNLGDAQSAFNTVTNSVKDVASPFVEATKTAMTFEHAMSRVKALTQSQLIREGQTELVAQNMEKLEKQALDLGATTQFTAVEAAQAMGFMGMAGWKTEQIYGTMPGMLDLAAAAGADLAQTADIVSDNMTAMGVAVKDAPHFMDVYAYALTNSNARLTDFGETMKYAAPVAKAYGSTLDETAAMVMMMANAGIKGSMAGTSLRMGLLRLAGPPKTATKEMEELGLSLSDAQAGALEAEAVIKGLGIDLTGATTASEKMTRVLMQLHEKTKNLSQDEKLAAFKGIFGVNAETGWLALFDQGPEVFMKYVEGLRNADGYSRQVAATMMDDTQGALTFLQSAIEAASLSVGRALTPAVRTAAETITPLIGRFAQWAEQNPRIIQGIVGIGAALAGVAVLVTGVALAFATWSFITAQIGMFTAGMAAVRSGMLATEVAALGMTARMGAAFATLQAGIAGISFSGIVAGIRAATMAAWGFIATPLGAALIALAIAAYAVYTNWDKIAPAISSVGDALSESLSGASQAIDNLMNALGSIGEKISEAFSGLSNIDIGFLDTIAKAFILVVNVIAGQAISMVNIFTAAVNTIADLFGGLGDVMSEAMEGNFLKAGLRAKKMVADIKKDWENINFSKMDFGYDIGGNISKQIAAYNQAAHPTPGQILTQGAANNNYASVFGGMLSVVTGQPMPQPAPAPQATAQATTQTPPVDTTQFKAGLDAAGQSALQFPQALDPAAQSLLTLPQNLQPTQEALAQFPTALEPATTALQNFPQAIEPATTALQNLPTAIEPFNAAIAQTSASITAMTTAMTANSAAVTENTAQLTAASAAIAAFIAALNETLGALAAFIAALASTNAGLSALAANSSSAASALSAVASAASAAASAMSSAAASIAAAASSAASAAASASAAAASAGGGAKANYKGGIYGKGAFLTWFAEKSPEAAIPLDKSQRAINLWTQAGQMLGVLPSEGTASIGVEKPASDATQRGIASLQREKSQRARKVYESAVKTATQPATAPMSQTFSNVFSTIKSVSSVQKSVQNLQAAQFDELGNIIGLNGAAGNVITKYDNEKIKHVKQAAQMKEYESRQREVERTTREVSRTAEKIKTTEKASKFAKLQEKFTSIVERIKQSIAPSTKMHVEAGTTPNPTYGQKTPLMPKVLTEQQRYRSEDYLSEKTQERIRNSKSYQAISKAMTVENRKSTSILNRGELNPKIATDITGGLFGKILGTDFGLGQAASAGGFKVQMPDVMTRTQTFPAQSQSVPNQQATTNNSTSILNRGELNPKIVTDLTGGLFGKIFGTDLGIGKAATASGIKIAMPDIMTRTQTFPTSLVENVRSQNMSERLERVATNETTRDYSAGAFQPTFHITVNVSGNGEGIDAKAIGEKIAYETRESFAKEFERYRHEEMRRAFT